MKILAAIKNALIVITVVMLNSIGFAGHSAAMSTMSHDMGNMKHTASDSNSCATLCRTAVVGKNENVTSTVENEEEEDEPLVPYFAQNQAPSIDDKSSAQQLYSVVVRPPPKIPIYLRNGAFRA